jgi:tubulin beta
MVYDLKAANVKFWRQKTASTFGRTWIIPCVITDRRLRQELRRSTFPEYRTRPIHQILDLIRGGPFGKLFRPDNFIFSNSSGGNNWVKGYFSEGRQICESVLDMVRKEVASPQVSDTLVAVYNCLLSIHPLVEVADGVFCADNYSLGAICFKTLGLTKPTHSNFNHLFSMFMAGTTCSIRFPGKLNADLRKVLTNIVPFWRLHYFVCSFAPLIARDAKPFRLITVAELTSQLFDSTNMMVACDRRRLPRAFGRILWHGVADGSRRTDGQHQGEEQQQLYYWLPYRVNTSICNIPPPRLTTAAAFIGNTTPMRGLFCQFPHEFRNMYARRSFVHWCVNHGLDPYLSSRDN